MACHPLPERTSQKRERNALATMSKLTSMIWTNRHPVSNHYGVEETDGVDGQWPVIKTYLRNETVANTRFLRD